MHCALQIKTAVTTTLFVVPLKPLLPVVPLLRPDRASMLNHPSAAGKTPIVGVTPTARTPMTAALTTLCCVHRVLVDAARNRKVVVLVMLCVLYTTTAVGITRPCAWWVLLLLPLLLSWVLLLRLALPLWVLLLLLLVQVGRQVHLGR